MEVLHKLKGKKKEIEWIYVKGKNKTIPYFADDLMVSWTIPRNLQREKNLRTNK